MPDSMTELADFIRQPQFAGYSAIVELVGGYMPGNSGPAAVTFARHCGHIDAVLYCAGIPTLKPVSPQTWMKSMGTLPKAERAPKGATAEVKAQYRKLAAKAKQERKNTIKERMQRLYPHLKVTLATADALGILTWAINQQNRSSDQ